MSAKSRILRVGFGGLFIGAGVDFINPWISLIGIVPIIIGITGFCPACHFIGRCSIKR